MARRDNLHVHGDLIFKPLPEADRATPNSRYLSSEIK